jgi:hypothetical protein
MTMTDWLNTTGRLIGTFGKREMELAAIRIIDTYGDRLIQPVDAKIFKPGYEQDGYRLLCQNGFVIDGVPQPEFWLRVGGRR